MKKSTAPARALKVQPSTRNEIIHFAFTPKHLTALQRPLKVGGAK